MHYIYRIKPIRSRMLQDGPTDDESKVLYDHFVYLKELAEKGIVHVAGRTTNNDETAFGIVIFEANSEQKANKIMKDDPAIKHGVMQHELFPFRMALSKPIHEKTSKTA